MKKAWLVASLHSLRSQSGDTGSPSASSSSPWLKNSNSTRYAHSLCLCHSSKPWAMSEAFMRASPATITSSSKRARPLSSASADNSRKVGSSISPCSLACEGTCSLVSVARTNRTMRFRRRVLHCGSRHSKMSALSRVSAKQMATCMFSSTDLSFQINESLFDALMQNRLLRPMWPTSCARAAMRSPMIWRESALCNQPVFVAKYMQKCDT
mmetsp:Transcript_39821/g.112524  ORF Transcript_39821/g.112524 Transcript_39821/m.112524 type:complete len:211 (-) Transcript_39821:77-709(-)